MYQPADLTAGERFTLHCRREGWSIPMAADIYGAHPRTVLLWQHDRGRVPAVDLAPLTLAEQVWIARRRLGITQWEMARQLRVHPRSIERSEREGSTGARTRKQVARHFGDLGWPESRAHPPTRA